MTPKQVVGEFTHELRVAAACHDESTSHGSSQGRRPAWARFRQAGEQTAPVRWPMISQGGQTQSSRPVPATPETSVKRRIQNLGWQIPQYGVGNGRSKRQRGPGHDHDHAVRIVKLRRGGQRAKMISDIHGGLPWRIGNAHTVSVTLAPGEHLGGQARCSPA